MSFYIVWNGTISSSFHIGHWTRLIKQAVSYMYVKLENKKVDRKPTFCHSFHCLVAQPCTLVRGEVINRYTTRSPWWAVHSSC